MKKKAIKNIALWSLILTFCLVLFGFSQKEQGESACWKMDISVKQLEGMYFIDNAAVENRILDLGSPILGSTLNDININQIQQHLEKMPSVKSATVYPSVDGVLKVRVEQRMPVLRIINPDGESYYIDEEGKKMPLSDTYTARVLVAVMAKPQALATSASPYQIATNPDLAPNSLLDDVFALQQVLDRDPFWSAQIEHLFVKGNGEIEMIPRVGNQRIVLGKAERIDRKLKKLKAFYDATVHTRDLNQYKTISLKYRDQVVCERYY